MSRPVDDARSAIIRRVPPRCAHCRPTTQRRADSSTARQEAARSFLRSRGNGRVRRRNYARTTINIISIPMGTPALRWVRPGAFSIGREARHRTTPANKDGTIGGILHGQSDDEEMNYRRGAAALVVAVGRSPATLCWEIKGNERQRRNLSGPARETERKSREYIRPGAMINRGTRPYSPGQVCWPPCHFKVDERGTPGTSGKKGRSVERARESSRIPSARTRHGQDGRRGEEEEGRRWKGRKRGRRTPGPSQLGTHSWPASMRSTRLSGQPLV